MYKIEVEYVDCREIDNDVQKHAEHKGGGNIVHFLP